MPSHKNTDPAINRIKIVARGPSVGELSSQLIKWFISFTPPGITFTCTDCDHPFCIPRRLKFFGACLKSQVVLSRLVRPSEPGRRTFRGFQRAVVGWCLQLQLRRTRYDARPLHRPTRKG